MNPQLVVFILIAVATAMAAVATVTSKNLVHAALFLAVTLTGIGGVFLVLHADFVGLVQLVVYVGAIAVLFLFGLMLTRAPIGREALDSQNRGLGIAIAGTMFAVLATLIIQSGSDFVQANPGAIDGQPIHAIGLAIFANWVFPFEVLSVLLLAALIGAILLSRRDSGESGEETAITRIQVGDVTDADSPRHWPLREVTSEPVAPLLLGAFLFCVGMYGIIARRNAVLVLMSVELMLNAVNINLVAFNNLSYPGDPLMTGQVFALFIIAVAAAEVGVGLAIVLNMFRNRASIDVDDVDLMRW